MARLGAERVPGCCGGRSPGVMVCGGGSHENKTEKGEERWAHGPQ